MHMATKEHIFKEHLSAWLTAAGHRKARGEMIRHLVFVTGMHPNSIPRTFRRIQLRDPAHQEKRGRHTLYTPDVTAALRDVWDAADEPCGELLHPVIPEYIAILQRDGMWRHRADATHKLLTMSERTVKRRVSVFARARGHRRGVSATKPSALKAIIPIFKGPWTALPPGHAQIDTVAHCGATLLGDFGYTVSVTDAATYWVGLHAQWNKGQRATVESLSVIKMRLPFPWLQAHPDTGSEFVNWHAKDWCDTEHIMLSRSEPGKKNDNMYVEERNGHVVRKYLGYERYDCPEVVPLMNDVYRVLDCYLNHFKAVRRQISKVRVGARYVRTYEKVAKTPYQRVLEHPVVDDTVKEALRTEHATLNPLVLKREIDRLRETIHHHQQRHHHRTCGCSARSPFILA